MPYACQLPGPVGSGGGPGRSTQAPAGHQFDAKPDGPDPAFARRLQEVLDGKWGELTVALQYLQQGWNWLGARGPGR